MSPKPDTILADRYQIREQLSKKLGRSTFLARDLNSQNLVIIKILCFDPDFQWDDLKLFKREALTLKNLDHVAIPKYLDYFDLDEADTRGFALIQTYIEAPSLETIIESGRKFSEVEVIELAERLLSILTYLHKQIPPVIHRDIKPSNVLLTNRSGHSIGDVYLVDFGSVQTAASKEEGTITIVGSYGYMPPEQFGGRTTTASDLYSLGMTLIYLLTGIHPAELPQVNGQVKFAGEISNRFRRWLEKMTHPYLDRRFDSDLSAQTALKFLDSNHGDFSNLKPHHCRTKLYRDQAKLEIFLPNNTLRIEYNPPLGKIVRNASSDSIDWVVWLLSIGVGSLIVSIPVIFMLVKFLFIIVVLIMMVLWCVETYYIYWKNEPLIPDHHKLVVNYDAIYATHLVNKTENIERVFANDLRSKADHIIYSPGYIFNEYIDDSKSLQKIRDGLVTIKPELRICSDSHQYFLGNGLSQPELYWLGQELSDFLNLELQVIYSTPKLPPLVSDD